MKKVKWLATVLVVVSIALGIIGCSSPSGPSGSGNGGAQQCGANGHSFGIWEIAKDSTETESVQMQRKCEVCGKTETKELEGFKFVKGTTITGTESWTPESEVFVRERSLTIPDLIVSDHEVTIGEYTAVMGGNPNWWVIVYDKEVNELTGDAVLNNPVSFVSWCYAIVYCNKRSVVEGLTPCYSIKQSTNLEEWGDLPTEWDDPLLDTWDAATCDFNANGYRLPTEAEWEWLARGGENYKYAGSDTIDDVAWYDENTKEKGASGTRDIKTKAPNGYGLYDMSGNVREWCWDEKSVGLGGKGRVLRGGSWSYTNSYCTVYDCLGDYPSIENRRYGFRVVRLAN